MYLDKRAPWVMGSVLAAVFSTNAAMAGESKQSRPNIPPPDAELIKYCPEIKDVQLRVVEGNLYTESLQTAAIVPLRGEITPELIDPVLDFYTGIRATHGRQSHDPVKEIVNPLLKNSADSIENVALQIQSIGGAASSGLALVDAIAASPVKTIAYVETEAFSAAAIIAVSASETIMAKNAQLMLHGTYSEFSDVMYMTEGDAYRIFSDLKESNDSMVRILAEANPNLGENCLDYLITRAFDNQVYVNSWDAVRFGFADAVDYKHNQMIVRDPSPKP